MLGDGGAPRIAESSAGAQEAGSKQKPRNSNSVTLEELRQASAMCIRPISLGWWSGEGALRTACRRAGAAEQHLSAAVTARFKP